MTGTLTVLISILGGRAERDRGKQQGESEPHQQRSEGIQPRPVEATALPHRSIDGLDLGRRDYAQLLPTFL